MTIPNFHAIIMTIIYRVKSCNSVNPFGRAFGMKKFIFGIVLCSVFVVGSFIASGVGLMLYGPDLKSVKYYADDNNYDRFECKVRSYDVYEDAVYISFEHSQSNYYDRFRICGKNFDLAMENGLSEILQENAVFTISSAAAYLGDGWVYPIVALSCHGDEMIPYSEGKQNFVEYQQEAENLAVTYLLIAGGAFVLSAATETGLVILLCKKRKSA